MQQEKTLDIWKITPSHLFSKLQLFFLSRSLYWRFINFMDQNIFGYFLQEYKKSKTRIPESWLFVFSVNGISDFLLYHMKYVVLHSHEKNRIY